MPIDASVDGTTYYPLEQVVIDDAGNTSWELFSTLSLPGGHSFVGGTFDSRYIYFAGRTNSVLRYDTQSTAGFLASSSWTVFTFPSALGIPGGFIGAVFDGRYVYFVPGQQAGQAAGVAPEKVVARFDTQGSFVDPGSWASFNFGATVLLNGGLLGDGGNADGGSPLSGFAGGSFDGRYLYLVPNNNGVPDGFMARFDTASDGGSAAFEDPSSWSWFNLATLNQTAAPAIGFYGAVFDGTGLYLAPEFNDAFDGAVHGGASSIAARFATEAGFDELSSWTAFDTSQVSGYANFLGSAGFDGTHVYFAPRSSGLGIVLRFDRTGSFAKPASWSSYDLTQVVSPDAGAVAYTSVMYDGRFVYFSPSGVTGTSFATLARYDTLSSFYADCAWTTLDLSQLVDGGASLTNFNSMVFDGQYLYLIPDEDGIVARFRAKSANSMPLPPPFYGSFL
jgi:hypothetical protein